MLVVRCHHLLKSNAADFANKRSCAPRNAWSSRSASSSSSSFVHVTQKQNDLDFCKSNVRKYDPAGMLPGHLLYTNKVMQTSYFAVRSFWVETGLRFVGKSSGSSSALSLSSTTTSAAATTMAGPPTNATPSQHLDWWQEGIEKFVFSSSNDDNQQLQQYSNHPTLRLLRHLVHDSNNNKNTLWTRESFETILNGRRKDLDVVKQYETLDQLVQHAEQSCGNLTKLVIQSGFRQNHNMEKETTSNQDAYQSLYEAARWVGICHGLTNALRTSIPVISLSGKLIIPAELTRKHGVKSPRYLLSALGQGSDDKCVRALQACVEDIVTVARQHLQQARELQPAILQEIHQNNDSDRSRVIMATLLPGVASETFLNRLEQSKYQLTDSNLRHVGLMEHATCAARMLSAYYRQTY